MKNKARTTALLGVCLSVAMVLSYIEFLLPPVWSAVPGIKLGLTNIIVIYLLYRLGTPYAAAVSLLRVLLSALLFGSVMTLIYSLSGAILSLLVMSVLRRIDKFSEIGVSIAGAVSHNLGQILAAVVILATREIGYYMIVLAFTGTVAGIFVGLCASMLMKYLKPEKDK